MSLAEELPVIDLEGPPVSSEAARLRARARRPREVKSQTTNMDRFPIAALAAGAEEFPADEDHGIARPKTRADCEGVPRPCPFVSCKFHLFLDVTTAGSLKLNFPDLEPDELAESCALDVAGGGGATLEEVGKLTNLTRERVRQIEVMALAKLQPLRHTRDLSDAMNLDTRRDGKRRLPLAPDESRVRLRDFTDDSVDDFAADDE